MKVEGSFAFFLFEIPLSRTVQSELQMPVEIADWNTDFRVIQPPRLCFEDIDKSVRLRIHEKERSKYSGILSYIRKTSSSFLSDEILSLILLLIFYSPEWKNEFSYLSETSKRLKTHQRDRMILVNKENNELHRGR